MDITTFKYCVSEVMDVIAKNNSFAIFTNSKVSTGNEQERIFKETWNSLFKDIAIAKVHSDIEKPVGEYDPHFTEMDSKYGDIYIYDAMDLLSPAYHIDLKVAAYDDDDKDRLGSVTVLSLANFSAFDSENNHYYLVSSFNAKNYKLFQAKNLLELIIKWYENSNWGIKNPKKPDSPKCQDYIFPSKNYTKYHKQPTYRYRERWTSNKNEPYKKPVHPAMMTKRDDDYIPGFVIEHFRYLK